MANPPGGPLGGSREQVERYAIDSMREQRQQRAEQQSSPAQREQQPSSQQAVPTAQEREAAEKQNILEQNARTAQGRIDAKKAEQALGNRQPPQAEKPAEVQQDKTAEKLSASSFSRDIPAQLTDRARAVYVAKAQRMAVEQKQDHGQGQSRDAGQEQKQHSLERE